MTIHLDHLLVPSRDPLAAQLLACLLGVPWSASGVGPFVPVYLNDGLTTGSTANTAVASFIGTNPTGINGRC